MKCHIDALVGEPIVEDTLLLDSTTWYGFAGHIRTKVTKVEPQKTLSVTAPGETPLPERVRIFCQILIQILAQIVGSKSGSLNNMQKVPVTFIPPFKVLTYCEQALRDWCTALSKKYTSPSEEEALVNKEPITGPGENIVIVPALEQADGHRAPERNIGDNNEQKAEQKEDVDSDDLTKSAQALRHLECLLQFIDGDITAKRIRLSDYQCCRIFLYSVPDGSHQQQWKQVYRVVHVSSARHLVVSP